MTLANRRYEALVVDGVRVDDGVRLDELRRLAVALAGRGMQLVWVAPEGPPVWWPAAARLRGQVHVVDEAALAGVLDRAGIGASDALVLGNDEDLIVALRDQWLRRRAGELPQLEAEPGWSVGVDGVDERAERAVESVLALADGAIGTSGSPLGSHPAAAARTLVAGVYTGVGSVTELLAGPVWTRLSWPVAGSGRLSRRLDLRAGVVVHELVQSVNAGRAVVLSSLAEPGTAALRAEGPAGWLETTGPLVVDDERPVAEVELAGTRGGAAVAAADQLRVLDGASHLDRVAVFVTDGERRPELAEAQSRLRAARRRGFDRLLAEHRAAWAARWADADVRIEGDDELQAAVRFCLFHLMASVAEDGEAAVGARGISGTGYRGHVFWDTDVFVLPFLAATHPPAARAILEYRLRRLGAARAGRGARRQAQAHASRGSRPRTARRHAAVGARPRRRASSRSAPASARNTSPPMSPGPPRATSTGPATTRSRGARPGDLSPRRRATGPRASGWTRDGRAHVYGVIGPDEYHEPVDDNAFTNVMARWTLRRALRDAGRRRARG